MRPPQFPRYRPALTDEEVDAIEASIPDGYYVSVLPGKQRRGIGSFAARLYRDPGDSVPVAVMLTSETTLASDVAWLVETYTTERAA
jgi:hypothetical protein